MKKNISKTTILVFIILIAIVGIFVWIGKRQSNLLNAHSWTQTEAVYESSSKHEKSETELDEHGKSYDITKTYYNWNYTYEVNGKSYSCYDSDHTEPAPAKGDETRTILIAEDDPSIYLMYESEDAAKESLRTRTLLVPIITVAIVLVILAAIRLKNLVVDMLAKWVD